MGLVEDSRGGPPGAALPLGEWCSCWWEEGEVACDAGGTEWEELLEDEEEEGEAAIS